MNNGQMRVHKQGQTQEMQYFPAILERDTHTKESLKIVASTTILPVVASSPNPAYIKSPQLNPQPLPKFIKQETISPQQ